MGEWFLGEYPTPEWISESRSEDELKQDAVNSVIKSILGFSFDESKGLNKASQKASSNSN